MKIDNCAKSGFTKIGQNLKYSANIFNLILELENNSHPRSIEIRVYLDIIGSIITFWCFKN